jgi:hypothetical protein
VRELLGVDIYHRWTYVLGDLRKLRAELHRAGDLQWGSVRAVDLVIAPLHAMDGYRADDDAGGEGGQYDKRWSQTVELDPSKKRVHMQV